MKKILSCLLLAAMTASILSAGIFSDTCIDTADVKYITDGEYNAREMRTFLETGGIIVDTSGDNGKKIAEDLGTAVFVLENPEINNDDDHGKDIAALYYKYGDNLDGIYIINVGTNNAAAQNLLINEVNEAVSVIRARQNKEKSVGDTPERTSSNTAQELGTFDVTVIREPEGRLNSNYKVYTVQDYNQRDYYIIKATVTGYPGCVLGAAYKSKYQGEGMYVNIGASTTSVTVDDYDPSSFSTTDTTVSVTGTPTSRAWEIQLDDDAQETFCDFCPGVTFDCPYSKASVEISVYSSYVLDSWNTFAKTIYSDRIITCKPYNSDGIEDIGDE